MALSAVSGDATICHIDLLPQHVMMHTTSIRPLVRRFAAYTLLFLKPIVPTFVMGHRFFFWKNVLNLCRESQSRL